MLKHSTKVQNFSLRTLHPYTPPEWAKKLKHCPQQRLKIAQIPTPIHKWNLPGLKDGFDISIKRDDLTGAALSGNKIRKLEFLMATALANKCDSVITIGGMQSNHCRATAVISRQLGIQPHLLLRSKDMDTSIGCKGNLLIDRLMGSKIVLCPYRSTANVVLSDGTFVKGLGGLMEQYAETLRSKGSNPLIIPVGGSNVTGIWGYIEAFKELIDQGVLEQFDDIVMAVGSGGTVAGVAIANYLTGSKLKVHGVCVCDTAKDFYSEADGYLKEFGLTETPEGTPLHASDMMDLIDGYKGNGYAVSTNKELELLIEISTKTGIVLDRVYTLKAVKGLLGIMSDNPTRFKGNRILFLHTGGIHSIFDGELDETVRNSTATNRICMLKDFVNTDD